MTNNDFERRAAELVSKMTVEEAASQLLFGAEAVDRLGVPEYNWWNEALHGVARAGTATVFPQSIGMAAMFDDEFLQKIFDVVSTEARAKYNVQSARGDRDIYKGLSFWTPNINIFRDPRWGRGQETYGEDPYLTERMGVAVIKGLQGDGKYLKTAACAKHFAAHSGPEASRHSDDVIASPKDLEETYLPAFEAAVREAKVETVMGAYTRLNGDPCCAHPFLNDKIRGQWGFDGHIVSDCWAVRDFHDNHKVTPDGPHSAALAVRMGCDINCGCTYHKLLDALKQGLITEQEIRTAAMRALRTRFRLGLFDDDCEYDRIPYWVVDCPEHREIARIAAEKSAVMLENDGMLPLDLSKIGTIAVIGPNAYRADALFGNYNGDSSEYVTNLDGIRRAAEAQGVRVLYSRGCDALKRTTDSLCREGNLMAEAETVAASADAVVLCLGLDCSIEGEEGDQSNGFPGGDRPDLLLPQIQTELARRVLAVGKPTVIVLNCGSCLDVHALGSNALIQMWYSGERGGEALANILFGKVSPSGKLPITFYYEGQPMPDFKDYTMRGRTYRYLTTAPLYPFGYGLTYSKFELSDLTLAPSADGISGSVKLTNIGSFDTEQVVQCYLSYNGSTFEKPITALAAFKRTAVKAGQTVTVPLSIALRRFESVLEDGSRALLDGDYTVYVGLSAPDARSAQLTGMAPLCVTATLSGGAVTALSAPSAAEPIAYPDSFDPSTVPARPKYDLQTGIGTVMRTPALKAALDEVFPEFSANPMADMVRDMYFPVAGMLSRFPDSAEKMAKLAEKFAQVR